jgi:hypothetical protein
MVLILATAIDPFLSPDHPSWLHSAVLLLDEIRSRGNLRAGYQKAELLQLEDILSRSPSQQQRSDAPVVSSTSDAVTDSAVDLPSTGALDAAGSLVALGQMGDASSSGYADGSDGCFMWEDGIDTSQLMMVADTLNLDAMGWLVGT